MSKHILITLAVILFSGIGFTSCKKEKQNVLPTTKEYLTGKWEMSWMAYDENMNKKLEEQEKESAAYGEESYLFLKADGTGYILSHYYYPEQMTEQQNLTWSLSSDEKELTIKIDTEFMLESIDFEIKELNLDNCVLEFSEDYGFGTDITMWMGLTKYRQ